MPTTEKRLVRPRYQIFVSSPYVGLTEARSAVIRSVLRLDWIPTAMEFFPAIAGSSWHLIQSLIEESDYFVVLLGGRGGTPHPDTALPITEMEYEYALEKEIPIARFVHARPDELPDDERETDPSREAAFQRFRNRLLAYPNLCALWRTREDLIEQVSPTLTRLSEMEPRPGWIRSAYAGMVESLTENGVSQVYATRDAAVARILEDIRSSKRSCWISAAVYFDKLIKPQGHEELAVALEAAGNRVLHDGEYHFSFCSLSTDTSRQSLAGERNAALLECWRRRERDATIEDLQTRIRRGSSAFENLARELATRAPAIRPERRFFRDYLVPHGLLVIDDHIAYVSFYDWGSQSGQQALTIRFEGGRWGKKFVAEAHTIRSHYSYRDYQVIAFDFDGVIADSMDAQARAWHHAARTVAVGAPVEEQLLSNLWMGAAGPRMFDHVVLDDSILQRLRLAKDEEFARLSPTLMVFADVALVLESLKEIRHASLTIATTATKSYVDWFLSRHSLEQRFDHIMSDSDVEDRKPHPEMLLKIAEQCGCQPWQICLVGDTSTDYIMSRNAGTDFVLFRSHEGHGVSAECVTATNWRQLEAIFLGSGPSASAIA
ncbi:MAG: HAD-IA family hydrolase [Phycisphaerales bacterium]|nr:HAD-IA family hydrolase [Phycisphaerales bacterium]